MAVGLAAFTVDFMTKGHYSEYLGDNYALLFGIVLAGLILLIISMIGLAWSLGKRGRLSLGTKALFLPIAVCIVASLIGGTNVHGILPLFVLPMASISIAGLIMLGVAAFTSKD